MIIKKGTKVFCFDDENCTGITKGGVYTVASDCNTEEDKLLKIKSNNRGSFDQFNKSRFFPKHGDKVRIYARKKLNWVTATYIGQEPVSGRYVSSNEDGDIIVSHEVKPEKTFKPITVVLNSDYTAMVHEDVVKVGCQTISFHAISRLYDAMKKVESLHESE